MQKERAPSVLTNISQNQCEKNHIEICQPSGEYLQQQGKKKKKVPT